MQKNILIPILLSVSLSLFAEQNINSIQDAALAKTIIENQSQGKQIFQNNKNITKLQQEVSSLKNKINVLEQLSKKNRATIIKIQMPSNSKTFPDVTSSQFKISDKVSKQVQTKYKKYAVRTWGANVRSEPSIKGKIVNQLKRGDVVFVSKNVNNWFYVPKYKAWMSDITIKKVQ